MYKFSLYLTILISFYAVLPLLAESTTNTKKIGSTKNTTPLSKVNSKDVLHEKNDAITKEASTDYSFDSFSKEELKETNREIRLQHISAQLLWYIRTEQSKPAHRLNSILQREFPNKPISDYFRALLDWKLKRYGPALAKLNKALAKKPQLSRAWNLQGLILNQTQHFTEALPCFQKATQFNPWQSDYFYNLALSYYSLKQYDMALKVSQYTLELQPNLAKAYYLQALAHTHKKEWNKALLAYHFAQEYGQTGKQFIIDYFEVAWRLRAQKETWPLLKYLTHHKAHAAQVPLLRKLAYAWHYYGHSTQAGNLLNKLIRKKKANQRDKHKYVEILVQTGRKAKGYIWRMPIPKEEKEKLLLYAQELQKKQKRMRLLQAQDPLLPKTKQKTTRF